MKKATKKKKEKKGKKRKPTKKTRALIKKESSPPVSKALVTMRDFNNLLPAVDVKTLDEYICGVDSRLTAPQKNLFKATATMLKLNPILKEVYAVGYWSKDAEKFQMSIIVGYDVYLKRAELTGTLDGWRSWTEGSIKEGNLKGMIEIFKRGWKFSFKHEVDYAEYAQKTKAGYITKFWADKPKTMIKKVVEAQGFRKAYPNVLGGMPYIAEELPPEMSAKNITPPNGKPKTDNTIIPEVLPPEPEETPARQAQELMIKVKWAEMRKLNPKKFTLKYFNNVVEFCGEKSVPELSGEQLKDLIKELEETFKTETEGAKKNGNESDSNGA